VAGGKGAVAERPPARRASTPPRKPRRSLSRLFWLQLLFCAIALALCGRLAYLQVWMAPELSAKARAQRTKRVDLAALRREITDRNGSELAVSVEAWSVYAQPADLRGNPADIARKLAPLLGSPPQKLARQLGGKHWTWLARKQDAQVANRVRALKIAGVGLIKETRRVYPKGPLAGTLLGFVGVDNQGLAGIEHDFDDALRGPPRHLDIQVDAMGREILRDFAQNPMTTVLADGARVILTIDEAIQHEAEKHLSAAIRDLGAKAGWVIVMEPDSGDVLAFATMPSYDPNFPNRASGSVITNVAISGVFEPGSTLKPFTVAAGLESGAVTPRSGFDCPPRITIGNKTIGDHDPPPGVRHLKVPQILQVSSNVGTAQIGMRMPDRVQREFLLRFGFGRATGSGLGGESAGILPRTPWRPINHATISYGQGISVTALQLATANCIFANGGKRVRPRLIRRIVGPDGHVIQEFPIAPPEQVLSPRVVAQLIPMLRSVTEQGGTGTAARIPGYHVAGKTGTAQKVRPDGRGYSSDVISSFVGFAPVVQPRIVVLASLDSPTKAHYASMTAAPLFREVTASALRILGVEPDPTAFNVPTVSHAAD